MPNRILRLDQDVALLLLLALPAMSQIVPTAVQATRVSNITSAATVLDNRSTYLQLNDFHTFNVSGSGTWSVQIQYSDTSATGPWTNFPESAALVTNTTVPPSGSGTGYHAWIRFSITGTVSINYAGTRGFYVPTSGVAGGGPPIAAPYLTMTPSAPLINSFAMSGLSTGIVKNTTGTGQPSIAMGTDLPTGIPIASLDTGTVTSTEYNYLHGVTSAIQTQFSGKVGTGSCPSHQVAIATISAGVTCVQLDVTSNYFANIGTTTTVLHGNASGNLSFSAVNLLADIVNTLPKANNLATAVYTDQSNVYTAGTQDVRGAVHSMPAVTGLFAALPATCTVGEQYFATDKPAGQNLYGCTATNTWNLEGPVGSGTLTNVSSACGLSGGPITTTGTLKISPTVVAISSTTPTLSAGNCGLTNQFTGASPAVTVPAPGGSFPNGWYAYISFTGSGTLVLTSVASTINGFSSVSINAANGAGGFLVSDGTNWEYISGGSSSAGATAIFGYDLVNTSATVQTVGGAQCTASTPCSVGKGAVNSAALVAGATATLSGTSVGGTNQAWWYYDSLFTLTLGHNAATTVTCSGCTTVTGITGFPADSIPLWNTTFTSLAWNSIVPATMDRRRAQTGSDVVAGPGNAQSDDPTTGIRTISTDPTLTPRYFTGSGTPALSCTAGRDFYTDTTGMQLYFCDATNTWKSANSAGTMIVPLPLAGTDLSRGYYPGPGVMTNGTFANALTYTGPGAIGSSPQTVGISLIVATPSRYVKAEIMASPTWSAASGTVDFSVTIEEGATNTTGSWNLTGYVGCQAVGAIPTFGTGTTVNVTPPTTIGWPSKAVFTALNLPASCAHDLLLQFWVERVADTGSPTGVPYLTEITAVIRGN
jgi:hypothetical protein